MTLNELYETIDGIQPDSNGCKIWIGRFAFGYGLVHIRGEGDRLVHRKSLERSLGRPIKEGYFACHSCDTPSCCNEEHLWEGTQSDNMRDMVAKQRRPYTPLPVEKLKERNKKIQASHLKPETANRRQEWCNSDEGKAALRKAGHASDTPENRRLRAEGQRKFIENLGEKERTALFKSYGRKGVPKSESHRNNLATSNRNRAKPVRCITDGREFDSARSAKEFYRVSEINAVCRGDQKTTGGLRFEYIENPNAERS